MTVTVHLLRHGEVHNPDRVLYGRLPGLPAQRARRAPGRRPRPSGWPSATSPTWSSSPLERAQQTAAPLAAATGLTIAIDERLIEADNQLQGRQVAGGKGLFTDPANWKYFRNPLRPSWGEPYAEIAGAGARRGPRRPATHAGGRARRSASATSCRSCAPRRSAEGRRLFHDPRRRECNLASVTSLTSTATRSSASTTPNRPPTCPADTAPAPESHPAESGAASTAG